MPHLSLRLRALLLLVCLLVCMAPRASSLGSWRDEALRYLNGSTFNCAHVALPAGDGFFRLRPQQDSLQQMMNTMAPRTELPLDVSAITGMSVDTLEALKKSAADDGSFFDIKYTYYRIPNWTMLPELEAALTKFDCLVSSVFITSDRVTAMDFQLPHAPFGFQVMTTVPSVQEASVVERIAACLRPFSMDVWLTILGLVALSAILIGIFEGGWGQNKDFHWWQWRRAKMSGNLGSFALDRGTVGPEPSGGSAVLARPRNQSRCSKMMDQCDRFGYSTFRAVTALTTGECVTPNTAAGRLYIAGLSIVFVILIASYTANLAAQLTRSGFPMQSIRSVNDFMSQGQVCCVRNSSVHIAYVRSNYPRMQIYVVPETSERALAQAIEQGLCAGAISTNVHLRYFLATDQEYACKMMITGDVLNFGYYAIPWGRSLKSGTVRPLGANSSVADAMSMLMGELLDSGTLNDLLLQHFPQTGAFQCDTTLEINGRDSLEILDLAGIFIIQAIVALTSIVVFLVLKLRSRRVRNRAAEVVHRVHKPILSSRVWKGSIRTFRGSKGTGLSGGGFPPRDVTGNQSLPELFERFSSPAAPMSSLPHLAIAVHSEECEDSGRATLQTIAEHKLIT